MASWNIKRNWLVICVCLCVAFVSLSRAETEFKFTKDVYNATIPENSLIKAYVTPTEKMGIYVSDPEISVRFNIVDGDGRLFRAVGTLVGDFYFLRIRTAPCRKGESSCRSTVFNREVQDEYKLTVEASVRSKGSDQVARTQVVIRIADINDLRPLFEQSRYTVSVPEDTPLQSSIARVLATDADIGTNGNVYYSFSQSTNIFAIHPTSGVVTLTRPVNYLELNEYRLTVNAQDRSLTGSVPDSTASLTIQIVPVNKYAPQITEVHHTQVYEPGTSDKTYAIISVTDQDYGQNGEIDFVSIFSGDPLNHFVLKQKSNTNEYNVKLSKALDRETTLGYNLTILAADRGTPPKTAMKTIEVVLLDRNDQTPVFLQDHYAVEVSEVAPMYTPVVGVKATDSDIGGNAKIAYEIISGNEGGDFEINSDTGFIFISKQLDRERETTYILGVSATNTEYPRSRRQRTTTVSVTVLDANDNSPVFNQTSYSGTVEENLPEGTVVITVNAGDEDAGENGYISYTIANLNAVPFAIDHFTGAISTTQVLDHESMRTTYILNVRASDWGEPYRREADVNVTIKVMNSNDNKPIFEKINCMGVISRDAPLHEPVTVVSALDFDDGNIISYEIISGNINDLFALNSQTGDLMLSRPVENADPLLYNLKITAKDGTNFADPMFMNITIMNNRNVNAKRKNVRMQCQSTDVASELGELYAKANLDKNNKDRFVVDYQRFNTNRHAPQFDSDIPSEITVREDLPVGSSILSVTATDIDPGYNGEVVYVIADGNTDSCFKIDTFTGELLVQAELDREKRLTGYDLTISVADLGSPSQTDKKTIHVTLEDANDHRPMFYSELYEKTLSENVARGTSVLKVEALDRDQGTNGEIRFSIISDTDQFSIDPESGELFVAQPLDREVTQVHVLRVQATDLAEDRPLSSVTTVTVTLEDVNDNAPQFVPDTYQVKLREDIPVGAVVTTIEARDPDEGSGGIVKYSLLSGFEDKFEIDEETGVVRLVQPLDYEQQQVYNITAKAKDKGTTRLSSTCKIEVEVIDVNENIHVPLFDNFVTNGSVYENSDIGTIVMQVVATDEDPGNDGRITYSIRDGSGLGRFTIDDTGTIRTVEKLDRETQERYWLTVYAQDRGAVPLHSYIDILIDVLDVNDNAPQTTEPVYYPSVMEHSPAGITVVTIQASDPDTSSNQRLTYRISSGNPQGFFQIDQDTGVITTTNRKLDRERQEEHSLEVTVSDNGDPPMTSTTRVIVSVDDLNDNIPLFSEFMYEVAVPARERTTDREPIFRVLASDADKGENAELSYFIRDGDTKGKFFLEPQTGILMTRKQLDEGDLYDLTVEVVDNGKLPKQRRNRCHLIIQVKPKMEESAHAPVVFNENPEIVQVMETDTVNHMITLLQAVDPDGGDLHYSVLPSSPGANKFFMHPTQGSLMLAEKLDWEEQALYNLSIAVSDGYNVAHTQIHVQIIDTNDNRPEFTEKEYTLEIPEDTEVNTVVLKVTAIDRDKDNRLSYIIHESTDPSSKGKFRIDSRSGVIYLRDRLDHETTRKHVLTVQAKDQAIPSKRAYVRVIVTVRDSNDHVPMFSSANYVGRVYETAAIGSSVVQVVAMDKDRGENSELTYSIVSGNLDDTFDIDPKLGIISVAKELDRESQPEYSMVVRVTDHGNPPLSNTTKVDITVTISNNAPPKFESSEYNTNIYENMDPGSFVIQLNAISLSSVYYEILAGNEYAHFEMNAHSGVISTKVKLDYENIMYYNLTVQATNMVGLMTRVSVIVHVNDRNDNPPVFVQSQYIGNISEGSQLGSVVLDQNNRPLVISATDDDIEMNAFLIYEIIESSARQYFTIDANTGAIRTEQPLDHEQMSQFHFSVRVTDMGQPKLQAEKAAKVLIHIMDINDSPPMFTESEFSATLLLPTYKGVAAAQVVAEDPDTGVNSQLQYSLVTGDPEGKFQMEPETGVIRVINSSGLEDQYRLQVRVSDGHFHSTTKVKIDVRQTRESGLLFSEDAYYAVVVENHTQVKTIAVVNALGNSLNEPLMYRILNPLPLFEIGSTSGVLKTTGIPFDREMQELYEIVVEVRDLREEPRVAHVIVRVEVLDINDNPPMFVNLPYFAVVQVDASVGDIVRKVTAIDRDVEKNSEVRYVLVDGGEGHFDINSQTGEITVIRELDSNIQNQEFTLKILASDKGTPKLTAEVQVPISVMNKAMPVFQRAFYTSSIKESIQLYTQVIHIQANSSDGRKLIYSITDGDTFNQFAIDHNTGVVSVVGPMDYETQQQFSLTVRASDTLTGSYGEVVLVIDVEDVNDIAPIFTEQSYHITLSESVPVGTRVTLVSSSDYDSGRNRAVSYHFAEESDITEYFHIDSSSGLILTSRPLDHEVHDHHDFKVIAIDEGMPALTSETRLSVTVTDLNDNPPAFEQSAYECSVSELAERGSFVTMVTATDPDSSDANRLVYSIVSGNEEMNFVIDSSTGIISLTSTRTPNIRGEYTLDVSVSDGVFTSSASVAIRVTTTNHHAPVFSSTSYSAARQENLLPGTHVLTVLARDDDEGVYGKVTYKIVSEDAQEKFTIDPDSGQIFSNRLMDHEVVMDRTMVIPLMATDGGGKVAYSEVIVALTDINDNAPLFEVAEYKTNVRANIPAGTAVITVIAVDSDVGSNADITYSIYDEDSDILDVFTVDPDTGVISTLVPMTDKEGTVFQFFVQAEDNGDLPLRSNVPVEVYVLEPDEYPPVFEETSYVYHVFEDIRVGSEIAAITAQSNHSVVYSIVAGNEPKTNNPVKFTINQQGVVVVSGQLDYETVRWHKLSVCAETETTPALSAFTDVTIQLKDANDNAPKFEANPYVVTLPENAQLDARIIQVYATDSDSSSNSKITYSLNTNIGDVSEIFAIDPETGWISLLGELDRETMAKYMFGVTATDSNERNPLSAMTVVQVEVSDFNDSPPVFEHRTYTAQISEEAEVGSEVATVFATDADVGSNAVIMYYITGGDALGHFFVDRATGQVTVLRPVDRELKETYMLNVTATDGAFMDVALLVVDIMDANDNSPICQQALYSELISESVPVGTYVVTVKAVDYDAGRNAEITYAIEGNQASAFAMNAKTGVLTTSSPLDRELHPVYSLHVTATDGGGRSCSTEISISLSDINDNPPQFTHVVYREWFSEKTAVKSLLTRVLATDPDTGMNRQVKYSFVDSAQGTFSIDKDSGIISLTQELDREVQDFYNLTVRATDSGTPKLSSVAYMEIFVLDEDDNPPEFEYRDYQASVSEDVSVGQSVVTVLATSRDIGVNAEITYRITGGNEHGKFRIDPMTGTITVVDYLDFEMATDYYLTVQAVDGGDQPQHDLTTVSINVTDANDNSPVFNQQMYSTVITEAAQAGDSVLQVMATDLDSGHNGDVVYAIMHGDRLDQFRIDEETGLLSITSELDREKISAYTLEVSASDHGIELQRSTVVTVQIRVSDINDNPPMFSSANYTVNTQEDTEINTELLEFFVTDADAQPNGSPFTMEIVEGNEGNEFRISRDMKLRPMIRFNQGQKDNYQLRVRATDSGTPALWSEAFVDVRVIVSKHPPIVSSPMEVTINSFQDDFPGGVIGKIHAEDNDEYDVLKYDLASNDKHLFMVDKDNGKIIALPDLDVGFYVINISVSDSKYTSYGEVRVNVEMVTRATLDNSLTIRFNDISPEVFLEGYYRIFARTMKNMLQSVELDDIKMISLQETDFNSGDLDVLFAVEKSPDSYLKPKPLGRKINESLASLEERMGVTVSKVFYSICTESLCEKTARCRDNLQLDQSSISAVSSTRTSFVSAKHIRSHSCVCKEKTEDCEDLPTLEPDFFNPCEPNPCLNHMTCIPEGASHRCACAVNSVDEDCVDPKYKPVSFSGSSYLHYSNLALDTTSTLLSAKIRTVKPNGNIMFGEGDYDYSILEIENGFIQYRFQCGSGEGRVQIGTQTIDDGMWHDVTVHRRGNNAKITLDNQYTSSADAPGDKRELNLDNIFFGAEISAARRSKRDPLTGLSLTNGLEGCMSDLVLNNERLPTSGDGVTTKDTADCDYSLRSACLSNPCAHGGTCYNRQSSFVCKCAPGWYGNMCQSTTPCGPSPCRNGGECIDLDTDFKCVCPDGFVGKTCTNYCANNPCENGGTCMEDDNGPACECPNGFTGWLCADDIDECADNPCDTGPCTNTIGGYSCDCNDSEDPGPECNVISKNADSHNITSNGIGITWIEIVIGAGVLVLIIVLVIIFVMCRRRRRRRRRMKKTKRVPNKNNDCDANSMMLKRVDNRTGDSYKRDSKLSNLDINYQPVPPDIPQRPASYTPSNHNSLNNLDCDRNYDDDQNAYQGQPVSQQPSLAPMPPSNSASDSDSIAKPMWEFEPVPPNVTENYDNNVCKKLNEPNSKMVKKNVTKEEPQTFRQDGSRTNFSSLSSLQSENEEDMLPAASGRSDTDKAKRKSSLSLKANQCDKHTSTYKDAPPSSVKCVRFNMPPQVTNFDVESSCSEQDIAAAAIGPAAAPVQASGPSFVEACPNPNPNQSAKLDLMNNNDHDNNNSMQNASPRDEQKDPPNLATASDGAVRENVPRVRHDVSFCDAVPSQCETDTPGNMLIPTTTAADCDLSDVESVRSDGESSQLGRDKADAECQTDDDVDAADNPFMGAEEPLETMTEFHDTHQTVYIHRTNKPKAHKKRKQPGYHWDCTDWMPPDNLPEISELPQYEVPDSPTESNVNDFIIEDEYVGEDTDYPEDPSDISYSHNAEDFQRQLENYPPPPPPPPPPHPEDSNYDSYRHRENLYSQHPSQYLPHHSYSNSQTSQDLYGNSQEMYGPPPGYRSNLGGGRRPGNQRSQEGLDDEYGNGCEYNADYEHSVSNMDNLSISVYSTNASCSDVSGLCEPDSEMGLSDYESGDDNLSNLHTEV